VYKRHTYNYHNISSVVLKVRKISSKFWENLRKIFCVLIFSKTPPIWNDVKDRARWWQAKNENITRRMRFSWTIKKTIKTHSKMFNTNCFFTTTTVRRTNINVKFISTLSILFRVLIEILTKTPLPIYRVNSWSNYIRTTICSGEPDSKLWISKSDRLECDKFKKYHSEVRNRILVITG